MATITLTENQIDQLLWAIDLTESSYAGWKKDDMGDEVYNALQTLKRIEAKLYEVPANKVGA